MQADDLDAFEAFFARHRGLIERTAYALIGDRQAAEEVLQDTFLRAYRHRASLRTDVSPVPWLYRVALNLCYSRLARRRLHEEPIGETTAELRDHNPEPGRPRRARGAPALDPARRGRPPGEASARHRPVLPPRAVAPGDRLDPRDPPRDHQVANPLRPARPARAPRQRASADATGGRPGYLPAAGHVAGCAGGR